MKRIDNEGGTGIVTLFSYGLGAFASAIKTAPLTTFLMVFYHQVVGIPPLTVSIVLTASLVIDAVADPLIGQLSDNSRSRWGRRIPFMAAAVVPVSVLFFALWNPPDGWPLWAVTTYFAACVIGLRLADTFFELPHLALIPELTSDYHKRTRLFTVRYLFEAAGGILIAALAYNVFLIERPDGSGGLLSRDGYPAFSLFTSILCLLLMAASTGALYKRIPAKPYPHPRAESSKPRLRQILETLNSRPFILLSLASIVIAVGSGLGSSLNLYWLLYYYRFSQAQMTILIIPLAFGIILTGLTPAIARRLGKRNAVICLSWVYFVISTLPIIARHTEVVPAKSNMLLVLVALQGAIGIATMTMVLITMSSMASDLIEEAEARTGRRSEGLLLAAINFVRKATQGFGTLAAGLLLSLTAFPIGAERQDVEETVLTDLAVAYLGGKFLLFLAATLILLRYDYDAIRRKGLSASLTDAR